MKFTSLNAGQNLQWIIQRDLPMTTVIVRHRLPTFAILCNRLPKLVKLKSRCWEDVEQFSLRLKLKVSVWNLNPNRKQKPEVYCVKSFWLIWNSEFLKGIFIPHWAIFRFRLWISKFLFRFVLLNVEPDENCDEPSCLLVGISYTSRDTRRVQMSLTATEFMHHMTQFFRLKYFKMRIQP